MPCGIEFVAQAENPVGFWLWRIATAVQDAEERGTEAQGIALDEASSGVTGPARRARTDAGQSQRPVADAHALLAEARGVAEGTDPHDAEAVQRLQATSSRLRCSGTRRRRRPTTASKQLDGRAF